MVGKRYYKPRTIVIFSTLFDCSMPADKKISFTLLVIALLTGAVIFLYLQNQKLNSKLTRSHTNMQRLEITLDSLRRVDMVNMVSTVLNKVDDELNANPKRTLSEERIASIVALCFYLKPYHVFENDSLSKKALSPDRGYILTMLSKMNIDSASLDSIFKKADFHGADLKKSDLRNADLAGVKLDGADLQGALLQGANLSNADLQYSDLSGANLSYTKLQGTNFKRAILKWAKLDNADLRNANLNGVDLTSAKVRITDWQGASMIWANATGALFDYANLEGINLTGTNFTRANLNSAILCNSNMIRGNLTESNLINADLTGVELKLVQISEEDWLSRLGEWKVSGAEGIKSIYTVSKEPSKTRSPFRLEKIEELKKKSKK